MLQTKESMTYYLMSNLSAQLGSLHTFWCKKHTTCGPLIRTMNHDLTDRLCQKNAPGTLVSNVRYELQSQSIPQETQRGRYRHKMHIFMEYFIRITKVTNAYSSTCHMANLSKFWLSI